jgi:class 3 adenylate cyclase
MLALPGDRRFVAFLDVLGFRHLVDGMFDGDDELYARVLEALRGVRRANDRRGSLAVARIAGAVEGPLPLEPVPRVEMMSFSDSVALTAPGSDQGLLWILLDAGQLALRLLEQAIPCRGGIALGRTHFESGILFGPAMNRAVDLEKQAVEPRIALDEEVLHRARRLDLFPLELRPGRNSLHHLDLFSLVAGAPGSRQRRTALERLENPLESVVQRANESKPDDREELVRRARWLEAELEEARALEDAAGGA